MSARRILIVYGTSYGQTAKVAEFVSDLLTASGDSVTLVDAGGLGRSAALPRLLSLEDFDGVVVGSSILFGRHQRSVRRFVAAHRDALNALPTAFFSVSGSAADRREAKRAEARRIADEFLREAGWRPALVESVAGAMAFTKYGPLFRWLLKRISAEAGGPTDTSRDHELTDWGQVRRFAEAFASTLARPEEARAPVAVV